MDVPGDDRRSAWNRAPEIVAAEQRILTYADALLTWLRKEDFSADQKFTESLDAFFTHVSQRNPGLMEISDGVTSKWILEKLDPDANRFFLDLLRSAWELRCWRQRHGEITLEERDRL